LTLLKINQLCFALRNLEISEDRKPVVTPIPRFDSPKVESRVQGEVMKLIDN